MNFKRTLLILFLFTCLIYKSQSPTHTTEPVFVFKTTTENYETSKSKSERTATPTVIKISEAELRNSIKIQDLIKDIPEGCNILFCAMTVSCADGTREFVNRGNSLPQQYLNKCQLLIFENIESSCPKAHKANYKIIVIRP